MATITKFGESCQNWQVTESQLNWLSLHELVFGDLTHINCFLQSPYSEVIAMNELWQSCDLAQNFMDGKRMGHFQLLNWLKLLKTKNQLLKLSSDFSAVQSSNLSDSAKDVTDETHWWTKIQRIIKDNENGSQLEHFLDTLTLYPYAVQWDGPSAHETGCQQSDVADKTVPIFDSSHYFVWKTWCIQGLDFRS